MNVQPQKQSREIQIKQWKIIFIKENDKDLKNCNMHY